MKAIKFLSIALLAATMLAGCNKADSDTPEPSNTAVKFTTAITKASGSSWAENDKIGVFMKTAGGNISTSETLNASNVLYTREGETFTTDNPIYYPQAGNVDFVAYYPRRTTPGTDPYIYKVVLGNQAFPERFDLLWSNAANVSKGTTAVALEFAHKLSRIDINIKAGDGLTPADLNGMSMTINGMATNADFDLATGILSDQSNVALIAPTGATPATGFDKAFSAIAVPQTTNGATTMSFTVGSDHYTYIIPASTNFDSGKSYPYTITISKTAISVTAGAITDWTSGGADVPGTAYSYQVGDYFPNPNVDLTNPDEKAKILGVVFRAKTATDKGLVVSLDETEKAWSTELTNTSTGTTDGAANMATISDYLTDNSKPWSIYPAFEWVYTTKNGGITTPWFLPARDELKALYAVWNGGPGGLEVGGMRTTFNGWLSAAGGTNMTSDWYWSSSESDFYIAWVVYFGSGYTFGGDEGSDFTRVRAVLAF